MAAIASTITCLFLDVMSKNQKFYLAIGYAMVEITILLSASMTMAIASLQSTLIAIVSMTLNCSAMGFVISTSTQHLADMTKVTVTSSTVIPTATSLTRTNLVMELVILLAHTTQCYVASMEGIVWMMWLRVSALESKVPKAVPQVQVAILCSLGMESAMPSITTEGAVGMERIAWNSMPSILRVE